MAAHSGAALPLASKWQSFERRSLLLAAPGFVSLSLGVRSDFRTCQLWLSVPPLERSAGVGCGAVNTTLYQRHGRRAWRIIDKIRFGVDYHSGGLVHYQQALDTHRNPTESGENCQFTCHFLISCTGSTTIISRLSPDLSSVERFQGQLAFIRRPLAAGSGITGIKKSLIIGQAGATAITLVPAMASTARTSPCVQRRPPIFSLYVRDALAGFMKKLMPERGLYSFHRSAIFASTLDVPRGQAFWPQFCRTTAVFSAQAGAQSHLDNPDHMRHFHAELHCPGISDWRSTRFRICSTRINAGKASGRNHHI